jgi:hypothetical protein
MKNILFQKVPINERGEILLNLGTVSKIHESIKNNLKDDDYILITSPMDIQKIDGNIKIIRIDSKAYSYNELEEIIEKAEKLDLCQQ